jgi:hypothetical protein
MHLLSVPRGCNASPPRPTFFSVEGIVARLAAKATFMIARQKASGASLRNPDGGDAIG